MVPPANAQSAEVPQNPELYATDQLLVRTLQLFAVGVLSVAVTNKGKHPWLLFKVKDGTGTAAMQICLVTVDGPQGLLASREIV